MHPHPDHTQLHPPLDRRRRGAVLLMILVIIVVLAAMLVQFTERAMTDIAAEGHYVERDRLRLTAYSALEATLAVVADVVAVEGGLTDPAQGWDDPLALAGFEPGGNRKVRVSFIDESGKLPLESLDEGTLILLFTDMGVDAEDALKLTQALLDWMDADDEPRIDGAESDAYAAAEWPYQASNRPVRRLDELAVVDGFQTLFFDEYGRPNDLFRAFAATVSVYGSSSLNANSMSELALRAAAGFGDAQVQALRDYRAGADGEIGTADDRYFASADEITRSVGELPGGARLGVQATTLRVRVEVSEGEAQYALEAVVRPQAGGGAAVRPSALPGQSRSGSRPATERSLSYPFVFLELTEDVGHNESIAAPAEPAVAATVAAHRGA